MVAKHASGAGSSAGVHFRFQGSASDFRDLAEPFFGRVDRSLRKAGFADAREWLTRSATNANTPLELTKKARTIRADLGLSAILIGVTVFLGSTVGSWAIRKVCDETYEHSIRPYLRTVLKKLAKNKGPVRRAVILVFQFGVWFATDRVYVQVMLETDGSEDSEELQALIPQAFAQAREWMKHHGVTHQFVTFRISHGQLTSAPELSDNLPKN